MKKPPPLPAVALINVLKVSLFNGWSVTVFAGAATAITIALGDWFGSAVGALVTAAGLTELTGNRRLNRGDFAGLAWLKNAQILMFSVLAVYCVTKLTTFDAKEALNGLPVELQRLMASSGLTEIGLQPLLRLTATLTYGGVILASLIHQGCLFRFYQNRRNAVQAGLRSIAGTSPSTAVTVG